MVVVGQLVTQHAEPMFSSQRALMLGVMQGERAVFQNPSTGRDSSFVGTQTFGNSVLLTAHFSIAPPIRQARLDIHFANARVSLNFGAEGSILGKHETPCVHSGNEPLLMRGEAQPTKVSNLALYITLWDELCISCSYSDLLLEP